MAARPPMGMRSQQHTVPQECTPDSHAAISQECDRPQPGHYEALRQELERTKLHLRQEIAERQRQEAALAQCRLQLSEAQRIAHVGSWEMDVTTQKLTLSGEAFRILGCEPIQHPLSREEYHTYIHAEDRWLWEQHLQAAIAQQRAYELELRLVQPLGFIRYSFVRGQPITNESGQVTRVFGLVMDISDRVRAERDLSQSKHLIQRIVDASPQMLYLYDCQPQRYTYVNRKVADLLGYAPEELMHWEDPLTKLVYPEDLPAVLAARDRFHTAADGEVVEWECRMRHADGSWRWLRSREVVFTRGGDRTPIQLLGTASDITEHKQAQERVAGSEERYRVVSELISDYAYAVRLHADGSAEAQWITDAFSRISGYTLEELDAAGGWRSLIHPDDLPIAFQRQQALLQGQSNISEYRIITKSGDLRWLRDYGRPVASQGDRDGSVLVYGGARDITVQKRAEEALERLRHRNELILNSAGEGICGLTLQGRISFINPAAARMLGYDMSALIGMSIWAIAPQVNNCITNNTSTSNCILNECMTNTCTTIESQFLRQDGSSFPVDYACMPIWERGQLVGAVLTFKDITDRRLVERMKSEFLSIVSHELRTPLASMHGSLKLIATGKLGNLSPQGQHMLAIAARNTDRLTRLIDDILDIQRLESSQVKLNTAPCNLADIAIQAIETMSAMAQEAKITLKSSLEQAIVLGDSDRLLQLLTNLLSNAIKFSPPETEICLIAQVQTDKHQVLVCLRDRGRGIPPDKLDSIFMPFQQVDASDARQKGGTGLGLAICRQIVQQHGGQIWAESALGQGSTMYFTLPLLG